MIELLLALISVTGCCGEVSVYLACVLLPGIYWPLGADPMAGII